jgi:osmotically-inducible protein OsmY
LVALAAAGSACGDGGRPAGVSTLSPSTGSTTTAPGHPSPGTTTNGAADDLSSGATVAPASTSASASASTPATSVAPSPAAVTDASLRAELIKRLGASPTLVGLEVKVRVVHRVVYLSGTVKSRAEKVAAEHIAVTEPGIAKVVSLLEVVPGGGGY